MGLDLDQFARLRKRCDQAKERTDRAKGALEQQMKKLETEFDCESVEDAERLLSGLEEQKDEMEEEYNKGLEAFEAKWEDRI